jgi:3-methyl-2-oxobutanoate hydroxymethyltransferase
MKKLTIPKIKNRQIDEKIVCITAYSARMAQLIDDFTDIILVGDSLGMTLHGLDSTVGVTIDMMIAAGKAVVRGSKNAIIVVDMPYGTYESDCITAYKNATKILQETGADAVKLEGGAVIAPIIEFLTQRNIAVMGHVGLLPQSVVAQGGYAARGKTPLEAEQLIKDIQIISKSGCFAIVLEGVIESVATKMVSCSNVPVIGIGASLACDGQVLVSDDLLGITEKTAKFVRHYLDGKILIKDAIKQFSQDVKKGNFPNNAETYA